MPRPFIAMAIHKVIDTKIINLISKIKKFPSYQSPFLDFSRRHQRLWSESIEQHWDQSVETKRRGFLAYMLRTAFLLVDMSFFTVFFSSFRYYFDFLHFNRRSSTSQEVDASFLHSILPKAHIVEFYTRYVVVRLSKFHSNTPQFLTPHIEHIPAIHSVEATEFIPYATDNFESCLVSGFYQFRELKREAS